MNQYTVKERRDKIIELLNSKGRVSVNSLSKLFGVSSVIIRGDLAKLEEADLLSRVHGGAITSYKSYYNMNFMQRSNTNSSEKTAIADRISAMIKDNDTLIMNTGTTPLFVMRAIADKKVTILTNSIALALEGAKNQNFRILLLGGEVDSEYQFTYGSQVVNSLEQYNANILVLSVDGIDSSEGISTFYHQETEICKKMISRSERIIVAADSSKFGRTAFSRICGTKQVDTFVTDEKTPQNQIKLLQNQGIEVITVKVK